MSKQKNDFLGENFSTATARLKRNLMFQMAQRLGLDSCFRCHNSIQTAEEISVDHKEPWLYVSKELFWNLNNLAFSHKRCNTTDRKELNKANNTRQNPVGKNWCGRCKRFRLIKYFGIKRSSNDGLSSTCKPCRIRNGN
jgi:HNH endonuclease